MLFYRVISSELIPMKHAQLIQYRTETQANTMLFLKIIKIANNHLK